MYLIKIALQNIKRNKNRYILFGILLYFVSTACVVAFIAYETSYNITEKILMDFGSVLVIGKTHSVTLSKKEIEKISHSIYMNEVRYFKNICELNNNSIIINDNKSEILNGQVFIAGYNLIYDNILCNPDAVTEGSIFENDDECIITDLFIEKYGTVKVGDRLKIAGYEKVFTVTGIADADKLYGYENAGYMFIYTTLNGTAEFLSQNSTTFNDYVGKPLFTTGYDVLYYIKSYKNYGSFLVEMLHRNNPYDDIKYTVDYAKEGFTSLIAPLKNTQAVYLLFIKTVFFIGIIIIMIMTFINLNERKLEIGVLRSIGMSKLLINILFISEIFLFITTVMIAGFISGSFLSGIITERMNTDIVVLNKFAIINSVSLKILLTGLGLTFISSMISVLFITRYQPMKILRSR